MVDAETERTIGLCGQHRWCRKEYPIYRCHGHIIGVCDRESDMFEYIDYKKQ